MPLEPVKPTTNRAVKTTIGIRKMICFKPVIFLRFEPFNFRRRNRQVNNEKIKLKIVDFEGASSTKLKFVIQKQTLSIIRVYSHIYFTEFLQLLLEKVFKLLTQTRCRSICWVNSSLHRHKLSSIYRCEPCQLEMTEMSYNAFLGQIRLA